MEVGYFVNSDKIEKVEIREIHGSIAVVCFDKGPIFFCEVGVDLFFNEVDAKSFLAKKDRKAQVDSALSVFKFRDTYAVYWVVAKDVNDALNELSRHIDEDLGMDLFEIETFTFFGTESIDKDLFYDCDGLISASEIMKQENWNAPCVVGGSEY